MNQMIRPMTGNPATSAWRLWIDRCGGFGLLTANRLTFGGARPDGTADVRVRSDWRRCEGTLTRRDGDYFWSGAGESVSSDGLLGTGSVFPISGSATLRLHKPSPLSGSAILSLDPPHRFDQHVDQILLVDQTVLIGPGAGNHVCCSGLNSAAVLVFRDGGWCAKSKSGAEQRGATGNSPQNPFVDLVPGKRVSLGDLDMMLEEV